jgi:L-ascorbate peroxidase
MGYFSKSILHQTKTFTTMMILPATMLLLVFNRPEFFNIAVSSGWLLAAPSSFPPFTQPLSEDHFRTFQTKYIRAKIAEAVQTTPDLAGPLIRLAFHDAATYEQDSTLTGGPNGSIRYELDRYENRALLRPLGVVQNILESMNDVTSDTCDSVSLADSIALAGAAAVEASGGPNIPIRMGRLDATTSDPQVLRHPVQKETRRSIVTKTLPEASLDSDGLRLYFARLGISEPEFVALSGVHGMGRHVSLLNMTNDCLKNLTRICLEEAPVSLPFVTASVNRFDNSYFKALLRWNNQQVELGEVAFIPTDVALVVDIGLRRYVEAFSKDEELYFKTFRRGLQKLMDTTATTKKYY